MTVTDITKIKNHVQRNEFHDISKIMFDSFTIKDRENHSVIKEKEKILTHFTIFLGEYLDSGFVSSKKTRLQFIGLIDKLNLQKELLELKKNQSNIKSINLAGKRLGRKSQSAFTMK